MRRHIWYVHKYFNGSYRGFLRVPGTFEDVDKFTVLMETRYGRRGWEYRIADTATDPQMVTQETATGCDGR